MLPYLTDCLWNGFMLHSALQMGFFESWSKRQLPEAKLFLKIFGSFSLVICQKKLCVPILWEPLETFLLLLHTLVSKASAYCFFQKINYFSVVSLSISSSSSPPWSFFYIYCKDNNYLLPGTFVFFPCVSFQQRASGLQRKWWKQG